MSASSASTVVAKFGVSHLVQFSASVSASSTSVSAFSTSASPLCGFIVGYAFLGYTRHNT